MSEPIYNAYTVRDYTKGREKRSHWTKIGVVFEHTDAEGFDVVLEALPVDGRVVIRKALRDPTAEEGFRQKPKAEEEQP